MIITNINIDYYSVIVAAAGTLKTVKLINYERNECYAVLKGHSGTITELEFSP